MHSYYQYSHVDSLIRNIEASYTDAGKIQYEQLTSDTRLIYPVIAIQKVHQIDQELETLYREFLSLLDGYHQAIENILQNSRQLSQTPEAIDKKIQELKEQYARLRAEIVRSVNVEQVRNYMQRIPLQ
jgi:exonuclease VII large subunit